MSDVAKNDVSNDIGSNCYLYQTHLTGEELTKKLKSEFIDPNGQIVGATIPTFIRTSDGKLFKGRFVFVPSDETPGFHPKEAEEYLESLANKAN